MKGKKKATIKRRQYRAMPDAEADRRLVRLASSASPEIDKPDMEAEQSTADVAGAFKVGNLSVDWYIDDQDPEAFRQEYAGMMYDPAVKAAFLALLFEVCALGVKVVPADGGDDDEAAKDAAQEVADFVKYALSSAAGGFARGLMVKIAKPALMHQFSLSEIVYQAEEKGRWAGKWVLKAIKSKDITNGFWQFRVDAFKNVLAILHNQEGTLTAFDTSKFVHYALLPDFENPRGMSHLRAAYRAWWVKRTVQRAWAVMAEKHGLIPVGSYSTDAQKKALEEQLKKFNARRWLAVPEGVKFEVVRYTSAETTNEKQTILRDLDKQIFLAIRLAFLQALEGDRTGARSMGEVHESTADLMAWFLSADLAGAITTQIVPNLVKLNYGEGVACPTVQLEAAVNEDLLVRSQVDGNLGKLGLPLSKAELYEVYGRKAPKDEADTVTAPAPASPFGGGGSPLAPGGEIPGEGGPGAKPPGGGGTAGNGGPAKAAPAAARPGEGAPPEELAAGDQDWLLRAFKRLGMAADLGFSDGQAAGRADLAFDPDQARDADGKWSATGGTGAMPEGQHALPLPPKQAPEHIKEAYRDRQRNYTRMRNENLAPDERGMAKVGFERAAKTIDDWKAQGKPGGGSEPPAAGPKPPAEKAPAWSGEGSNPAIVGLAKKASEGGLAKAVSVKDGEGRDVPGNNPIYQKTLNSCVVAHKSVVNRIGGLENTPPLNQINIASGELTRKNSALESNKGGCLGLYDGQSKNLYVGTRFTAERAEATTRPHFGSKEFSTAKSTEDVFRHEFGHHVMRTNPKVMNAWATAYMDADLGLDKISKYAKTSLVEGFAEAFAVWTHPKYAGGMPPATEKFMSDHFPRKKGA